MMQPWRSLFRLFQECPWKPGRNLLPSAGESHCICSLQQQEIGMEISAPWALQPSYTPKPYWCVPLPLAPFPGEWELSWMTPIQTFLCFGIPPMLTSTPWTTSKPAATCDCILKSHYKLITTKQNHSQIRCWWGGTNSICTSWGENSPLCYPNKIPAQSYSSSMNYTSRFAFCNILVPDPILVPINATHQNCGAQSETCHGGTVFTGRTMPWQMFPVRHPQCIRLQLNTDLQPGRSCKEDAKEKKHYN